MFSGGLTELLFLVIKSWQVIAMTIVVVLFLYLVNYFTHGYYRPRFVSRAKPKRARRKRSRKPAQQDISNDIFEQQ